jgi:hypothetical protein
MCHEILKTVKIHEFYDPNIKRKHSLPRPRESWLPASVICARASLETSRQTSALLRETSMIQNLGGSSLYVCTMIQISCTISKEVAREIIWSGNMYIFFKIRHRLPSYDVLALMSLLLLWSFNGDSAPRVRGSTDRRSAVIRLGPVTRTMATTKMPRFTNENMHFTIGFAMEILSLHWGDISMDIWIGDNFTIVYLKECIVIWERGTRVSHALAGCGRRNVRDEEDVLDVVHDNPSASTRHVLLHQDDFLREQLGVLCVRISCIRFIYNQCDSWSRRQTSPSTVCSMVLCKIVYTPQFLFCGKAWRKSWCRGSSGLRRSN